MSIIRINIYIWSIFWIYWILSAIYTRSKIKKEFSGQENIQRTLHLIFVIIAFVITFFQINFIYLGKIIIDHNLTIECLGTMTLLLSLLFATWARITLGRNWTRIQKLYKKIMGFDTFYILKFIRVINIVFTHLYIIGFLHTIG